jgi:CheY-like chemotaxis protein
MENLPVERAEAVAHILQGGKHLLDLIDEVLDIARIETVHLALSLQPVELVPLLSEALDLSRPMAERMSVDLTLDTHALAGHERVFADRQRLLQVMLNLLSNAIKYNATGGSVEVSARTPVPDDGRVLIAVADDGPGISPDSIARVFDPFERLGAERSSVEGTGVGLTLSQHLVKEMGGEISVSSELGAGTTFTVALSPHPSTEGDVRADSGRAPGDPAPASAPRLSGGLRVLHAEDNLANLELVEKVLARVGNVDLVSATDGSQALALAREERPDLLLLDLHLPDMSGRQVLEQLRADPLTSEIPVVIVSADSPALFEQPLSDGVVACLTKPIDVRELMRVVERALSGVGRSR